ncbi:MAG: hypothetical protein RLN88_07885 [Ekhidna sp.]|uniref:hypothetical protein n=1 Tax=Ekhidna sp. TaxID=2608089 RepID=UPI0032EFE71E
MNIKSSAIFSILFILISIGAQAQKIKYKDLFPLLSAKKYDEAGPQLIQFLSDPKNAEEANANLQMGMWLEDRFLKYDVVADSSLVYQVGDSAVFFLEKAKGLIDEKELKKQDEYYQAFFRRDLRTGEFGIKVSDVHLDIEKKVEGIEKRIADVKEMHRRVVKVENNQKAAMDKYRDITTKFTAYNNMLIGADQEIQAMLADIESNGRKGVENAKGVQELAEKLGSDKYREEVNLKSIEQFGVDGMNASNIRSGVIEIWNFEEWARDAQSEIIGGVALFKTMVNKYAEEIRTKKEQVKNSQDVEVGYFPDDLQQQFNKYDPESTVEKLLKIEMYEARITKQVDIQLNPALTDSSLIGPQLEIFSAAYEDAKNMNVLVESITSDDLETAKKKYKDYIESFFKKYVTASKYVQDMQAWSRRNVEWLGNSVEYWTEKNRWGSDSEKEDVKYPLFVQGTPEAGFMTLDVPVNTAEEIVAYGANINSKKGYVASFGPDRIAKWKVEFDLPGTEATKYESDSIPTISGSNSFFIYNPAAAENNFVVVSYTPSGQLNWGTVVTLNKRPVDFKFDDLTQELTILLYPEEQLPLDSDELGYVVIDRTGNAR